jgi:two-component system, cell cycle sensor histidine kinase and response regulator CckA
MLGSPSPQDREPSRGPNPVQDEISRLHADLVAARAEEERLRCELARHDDRLHQVVGRLAGGMAHDFNNLLTIITGYAMLLNEDEQTSAGSRERLGEILRACTGAKELTQKLLVLSRKQASHPRVIEIDQFLRNEAVQPLEQLAGARITVVTKLSTRGASIHVDPAELMQMLTSLVLNARDAMPAGGVLTIATTVGEVAAKEAPSAHAREPHVGLSITDTGAGMDEAVRARLFEPFFTTKRLGTGAGLGLAIIKGLIEQAGGFIEVTTAPSRGTTMTLWIPLTSRPRASQHPPAASPLRGGNETVLLVEDEPAVRELTRALLGRLGYRVTDAADPDAAINLAREGRRFDLIVSDLVMPGMDGRQLMRELGRLTPGVKVLFISGYAETQSSGDPVQCDVNFLAKPFTPAALAQKVRDALDAN